MKSDSARFLDTLTELKRPYTQTSKGSPHFSSSPPGTAKTDYYTATWTNFQKHQRFYERSMPKTAVPTQRGVEKVTSKHLVLGNRFKRITHMDRFVSEVSDKRLVEDLDDWNRDEYEGAENLKQIQLAEFALHNRIKHNDVEHFIMDRKSRSAMPAPLVKRAQSEAVLRHVQDITIKRMERKAMNEMLAGQSKNARRYEDEMTTNYTNLKEKVAGANRRREELRKSVSSARSELLEIEEDMTQLRRYFQEEDLKDKKRLKNLRPEDLAKLLSRKSQMQNDLLLKEKQHAERVTEIKNRIRDNSELAKKMDAEVASLRLQLEAVTASQARHYKEMLTEGNDTRTEGLLWIVKRLWHLGQDVMPDMFPEFLDIGSVDCILFLSQKSFELDEINDYLNSLQNGGPGGSTQESRRDRWNNIHRRIKLLTKNLRIKKPLFIYDKKLKQTIVVWEPAEIEDTQSEVFYQGGKEAFNEVLAVDNAKQEIKQIIQQTQEAEVKRLTRECFLNNYERRYKVSMKQLLSTIVGKETIERFMALIEKDRKELADELAKAKTFRAAEHAEVALAILERLNSLPESIDFQNPVDYEGLNLQDYLEIVSQPMDLSTIREKLDEGLYENIYEFMEDLKLVWDNCKAYNQAGSEIVQRAKKLERIARRMIDELESSESTESEDSPLAEVSFEEKVDLAEKIRRLDSNVLADIVYEIKKVRPEAMQDFGKDKVKVSLDGLTREAMTVLWNIVVNDTKEKQRKEMAERLKELHLGLEDDEDEDEEEDEYEF